MANKILNGQTYYGEIRGRLGVSIVDLPNTDIDARSIMNIAENKVIESVPDYATLTGTDSDYVYTAAICMVAAMLAPSMWARIKKSKKDFDSGFENQAVKWDQLRLILLDECYAAIGCITTQPAINDSPMFGFAGPTRANAPKYLPGIHSGDVLLNNV